MLRIHLVFQWCIWCSKFLLLSTSLCPGPRSWRWHDISLATSAGCTITPILFFWYPTKNEAYYTIMASSSNTILQKLYCLSVRKGVPKRVQVLHKHRGQLRWGKRAERQHNTGTTGKTSVVIPKRFTTGGRRLTSSRAAKRTISYDVVTDTGLVRLFAGRLQRCCYRN